MGKIRIKNFGPIKEGFDSDDGFMDINKVTVFIGEQGTGKSTVAKLISTLTWMEKAMNRGQIIETGLNFNWFKKLCGYQKIQNYFSDNTEIEYTGDAYSIKIVAGKPAFSVKSSGTNYIVPKIMYVPAERNFLSIIMAAYDVTGLPDNLYTFAEELKRTQLELKGTKVDLPVRNYIYEYDEYKDVAYISRLDNKQINLLEASSGLQSLIPLYLVSKNLASSIAIADDNSNANISVNQLIKRNDEIARITMDDTITDDEKKKKISRVYAKFHNKCFINIVEEPEQNLYPVSQWEILKSLLELNSKKGNKLVLTTHSPYIINYLTLAVKANLVLNTINQSNKDEQIKIQLKAKLDEIVSENATVPSEDIAIYELDDKGKIIKLKNYMGLPSDENYLNEGLAETNDLFSQLLDIEDLCQ